MNSINFAFAYLGSIKEQGIKVWVAYFLIDP